MSDHTAIRNLINELMQARSMCKATIAVIKDKDAIIEVQRTIDGINESIYNLRGANGRRLSDNRTTDQLPQA